VVKASKISFDPVVAWLGNQRNAPFALQHSLSLVFDGTPVSVYSNASAIIAYLQHSIAAYYPDTSRSEQRQPGCRIDIYLVDDKGDRRIILPFEEGASMQQAIVMPSPQTIQKSDQFIHMQWGEIESYWRPFDCLASLKFSETTTIHLLISVPTSRHDEPVTRRGALRVKIDDPDAPIIPLAEIADQVRTLIIRSLGHFCLHAAAVANGQQCVLLMGPSGSGKTTTALALLRGGFELLSDEHTLLQDNPDSIEVMGFRSAPRMVGDNIQKLSELEKTLFLKSGGKFPFANSQELRFVGESRWIRPAGMFFLQIHQGAHDHAVLPLTVEEAFVRVTNQVIDPTNVFRLDKQSQALIRLVENCASYEFILGDNLDEIPKVIERFLDCPHESGTGHRLS
jgi:hypothetical protein